ncbi:MAG: type II toxin-antitoxin system death-on-curing family toxin [Alphaproteobacteria bacterium]|nr:type II toxin-antitoxin system death-on-curing family toxin [Alphaproteobacteria bacterium]
MSFYLLSVDLVESIHDEVLNPGELPGRALDKSLEGAMARVDHRLAYGMIDDVFELAATYAVVIATGHCFNDGNKRTAFRTMQTCLEVHGVELDWNTEETGQIIISTAQGLTDEGDLADWLRKKAVDA